MLYISIFAIRSVNEVQCLYTECALERLESLHWFPRCHVFSQASLVKKFTYQMNFRSIVYVGICFICSCIIPPFKGLRNQKILKYRLEFTFFLAILIAVALLQINISRHGPDPPNRWVSVKNKLKRSANIDNPNIIFDCQKWEFFLSKCLLYRVGVFIILSFAFHVAEYALIRKV